VKNLFYERWKSGTPTEEDKWFTAQHLIKICTIVFAQHTGEDFHSACQWMLRAAEEQSLVRIPEQ